MAAFTDKNGDVWNIVLDVNAIENVRQLVKNRDGKEVDLLATFDQGDFSSLRSDVVALIDTVFTLCLAQVQEQFDIAAFDAENELLYEANADWKAASKLQKSMRWFASLGDGPAIERMTADSWRRFWILRRARLGKRFWPRCIERKKKWSSTPRWN